MFHSVVCLFFSSLLSLTSSLMTGRHLSKQFLDFWKSAEHFSVYETFYVISVALLFLKLHSSVLLLTVLLTELVIAFPPFVVTDRDHVFCWGVCFYSDTSSYSIPGCFVAALCALLCLRESGG